jgi:hypothetical protein
MFRKVTHVKRLRKTLPIAAFAAVFALMTLIMGQSVRASAETAASGSATPEKTVAQSVALPALCNRQHSPGAYEVEQIEMKHKFINGSEPVASELMNGDLKCNVFITTLTGQDAGELDTTTCVQVLNTKTSTEVSLRCFTEVSVTR